jgi:hypothetical protein
MRRALFLVPIFSLLVAVAASAEDPILRAVAVDGSGHPITAQAWAALPRTSVQAIDHDGKEVAFEGVAAREVLKLLNAPLGKDLRGKNLVFYVLAEAADGYRAVYALTEFDADFTDRIILIADRRNGQPLAEKEGPLRIVVPGEKRQARWLRELVGISLKRAP